MNGFTDIEYRVDGCAAVITLNRPEKLNAFTYHTLNEIRTAVNQSVADSDIIGIVLTGNGRGFSAGLDSQVLAEVTSGKETTRSDAEMSEDELPGIFSYLLEVPKPVIAAVNGVAAGGGLILALMSDIRIASTDASFITVFLKRGLIAEHGSSWILPRMVGTGRALDLLWMSDRIDAATAQQLGLVEKLVEPDQLVHQACAYIERMAETSAPLAIAETKRLVYGHLGKGYVDALHEANESQNRFIAAPDASEGASALLEKRKPNFQRLGEEK
ncbi:MAG: enoyl-CoA hydratase-related protein [bacterium]|nr:enoyl-CoA hydratase [Gammaproteobacteria bacterium]HIL96363.1 enoyl-CoA hydratase [Pseudomonadales bacterium]